MSLLQFALSTGIFVSSMPWQAEISFLVLVALLAYAPAIIRSIRQAGEDDHREEDHHSSH